MTARTLRILVVEDNALNLQLVRDILEYRGHEVEFATSVQHARERLQSARPDLVLIDIQLPGGGGEKLLREIRANAAKSICESRFTAMGRLIQVSGD